MRRGMLILFFMIVLNTMTLFVNDLPLFEGSEPMTPYNRLELEKINGTETADNWDAPESGGLFGDQKGFLTQIRTLGGFVDAFPTTLGDLGMPIALVSVFSEINVWVWWFTILDVISGGKIYG